MATTGKNTVQLVVEAGVTGEEQIRRLGDTVRRLAREGGDAAPEFLALATQLDRLGDQAAALAAFKDLSTQVASLAAIQAEAAASAAALGKRYDEAKEKAAPLRQEQALLAESLRAAEVEVSKAKGALDTYVAGFTRAQKDTAEFVQRQAQLKAALADARTAVVEQEQALERLAPGLRAAATEEGKLQRQYEAQQARVVEANEALRRRNVLLQEAQAVVLAAGASTTDLVAAETAVLEATQAVARETQRLTTAREQAAAVAAELAALDAQNARVLEQRSAQLIRIVEEYDREEASAREAAAATAAKAAADERAAIAARELAEATRLAEIEAAGLAAALKRGQQDLQAEVTALREAEQFSQAFARAQREAAAAAEALSAAEGAAAIKRLEEAAKQADAEFRELTASLRTAEAATQEFTAATERAAAAGLDDAQAAQARLAAAEKLVASERELGVAQRELIAQRDAGRAALVAEAQALLTAAAAARESQAATTATAIAARQAGQALQQAFGTVGIRSIDAIEAEIEQVNAALTKLESAARRGALGQDELARAAGAAEVKLARLRGEILQVQSLPSVFERLSDSVNGIITRFAGLGAAIATVGVAVRPVVEATIALDQIRRVLTQVTGSAESAEQQIDFLRKTAQASGQAFSEVGQSYAKFAASALQSGLSIEQVNEAFKAVSLAAGNLGLSSDQAKRALEALGQIASKGTVSLEELRQQLGDALPGVLPLLAKELGLTQRELLKVVESGQLLASEGIPAIARSLSALTPASGSVEGLVASFNRFVNVIKQAGTEIVDGPVGTALGVLLKSVAGVFRDVAVVAVSASEALKLFGLTVVSTIDALTPGGEKLSDLGGKLSTFAEQAGERIAKFKETAYGADDALQGLNKTLGFTGQSFAKLTLEQQKQIEAAALQAQSAEKNVQAKKAEADAITRTADLLGDEASKRAAAADAAKLQLQATEEQLIADQGVLNSLTQLRDKTLERAGADKQALDGVKALLEETDKKIAKAQADVEKTQAQVDAARAFKLAQDLATQSIGDQSGKLESLREAVEKASQAQALASRRYAEGKGSLDAVKQASDALALAKGLLRDAISDLDDALKKEIGTLKADLEIKRAGLELDLAQARNLRAAAIERNNETQARQLGVRILEIEQALRRTSITGTLQEAEATLRYVAAKEEQLRASGQLTAEIEKELELQRKAAVATLLKAQAQVESNREADRQLDRAKGLLPAIDGVTGATQRSTSATNENSTSLRSNSSELERNAKSTDLAAEARARYNDLLANDPTRLVSGGPLGSLGSNPDGVRGPDGVRSPGSDGTPSLSTLPPTGTVVQGGSAQVPVPAGYYYTLDPYAPGAVSAGTAPNGQPYGGYFAPLPGSPSRAISVGAPPAPSPPPGAAPTSGPVMINVNIGGRNYGIGAASMSDAERAVKALEDAYRAGGGG